MLQISSVLERTDFSGWDTKCVKDRNTDFNGSGVSAGEFKSELMHSFTR